MPAARYTMGTLDVSRNVKIGPVMATYRAIGTVFTCTSDCLMVGTDDASCYAGAHHVGIWQRRARTMVLDVAVYIQQAKPRKDGKPLGFRHLVSGDLKENGQISHAYIDGMVAGHIANPNTYGWGYTHAWRELDVTYVNGTPNCTINASCETDSDIRQSLAAGWSPVTIVAPTAAAGISHTTDAYAVLTCPQQTGKATCDTCQLCAVPVTSARRQWRGLPIVIGFRVHGNVTTVSKAINAAWLAPTV
jgi:hypothetical protein